jgi:hypothetical protein
MYLLLFINYYNKVCYINVLNNINMLFTHVLYLVKYYYIKIKLYATILKNKYINLFLKKMNN